MTFLFNSIQVIFIITFLLLIHCHLQLAMFYSSLSYQNPNTSELSLFPWCFSCVLNTYLSCATCLFHHLYYPFFLLETFCPCVSCFMWHFAGLSGLFLFPLLHIYWYTQSYKKFRVSKIFLKKIMLLFINYAFNCVHMFCISSNGFLLIKDSWGKKGVSWFPLIFQFVFNIDNEKSVSWLQNMHITVISEGTCDTEDWSNEIQHWILHK